MNTENEKKKSKYLRDKNEPASKLRRSKDDKPSSKYLRSKEEAKASKAEKEYRKNVITPKRAKETLLEEERAAEETAKAAAEAETTKAISSDEVQKEATEALYSGKGSAEDIFNKATEEKPSEEYKKKVSSYQVNRVAARMALCIAVLTAMAVILKFLSFRIPYMPTLLLTEFSTFPELIAAIAYGPLYGVLICILKTVIHMMAVPTSVNGISDLTNFLLNSSFVFIAGLLYSRSMFAGDKKVVTPKNNRRKDYRRSRIFRSTLAGAVISAVPQFFITRYIAYPLLLRVRNDLSMELLLNNYQVSYDRILRHLPEGIAAKMPQLIDISRAIILFNLPLTFVKLFIITVITALVYKFISPFLHYRGKDIKKKK